MPQIKVVSIDGDGTAVNFSGDDPEDPRNKFRSSYDAAGFASEKFVPGNWDRWIGVRDKYYPLVTDNPDKPEIYEEWCRKQASFLKGIKVADIMEQLMPIPYNPGVKEFFHKIKQDSRGYVTGIVSSGLNIVMDQVMKELGLDFAISTKLEECDGVLTGTTGRIVPFFGKAELVRKIAQEHGASLEQTAYFGDHENDIPVLEIVGLPIAVCPKEEVKDKVIAAARGNVIYNLMDALPIIKEYERT